METVSCDNQSNLETATQGNRELDRIEKNTYESQHLELRWAKLGDPTKNSYRCIFF